MRVHLWLEPQGKRIRQVLITGDFFSRPDRFVLDLEAALKGVKADKQAVAEAASTFFGQTDGEIVGIGSDRVIEALCAPLVRMDLLEIGLTADEANEIFLVNLRPDEIRAEKPAWLLLPYCSKKVDCDYRKIADCIRCGECEFDEMYGLAETRGLVPYSIQSFEHLMEILNNLAREDRGRFFVGSCCDAFFAKHQREMEASGARGVLINLDSTTCYDLGKGMEAYVGNFENKTDLNRALIRKVVDTLHDAG
jgi:lipoate-protein ligase A